MPPMAARKDDECCRLSTCSTVPNAVAAASGPTTVSVARYLAVALSRGPPSAESSPAAITCTGGSLSRLVGRLRQPLHPGPAGPAALAHQVQQLHRPRVGLDE